MAAPKKFARFAPAIAAMNPVAFRDEADALRSLSQSYSAIRKPDVVGVTTGGYKFTKDEDGFIELWIAAEFAFKD